MKKVINIVILIVVIICFGKVSIKLFNYYRDSKMYNDIQELKPSIEDFSNDTLSDFNIDYTEKEKKLLNINEDYKMWLSITNTNIDYPVVQGEDNEFYLSHSFNKEESISGALFIDSNNNINVDKNIVIYGHHMKNETMFHNLNYFKEEEFFNENKINIIRSGKQNEYEPFSVYVIPEEEAIFNMSFSDDSDYKEYLANLGSKSYFYRDINLDKDSEIITLITCSYEYDGARTVVHAIRYN